MPVLPLLLAAAIAAVPAPSPTATNPFTLEPLPRTTTLPVIGTTRNKPVCSAIRSAAAPAVQAAMKNDQVYKILRARVYDYVVKDSEEARDLHLTQMDRQVDQMVKAVDALQKASDSPALEVPRTASPEDAKSIRDIRDGLKAMLTAQKVQLDAMSGFVETERMRRFGRLSESEQNLVKSLGPESGSATAPPVSAFLRDSQDTLIAQHQTPTSLHDAFKIDRDLGDIAAVTASAEKKATDAIVPAANRCR